MADLPSNLPQILTSQSLKEVTANAEDDAASPSTLYGRNAPACAALTWGYLGGWVPVAGVPTLIANGTLTLTASVTNYIRKLDSTGVVSFVTSAPTSWPALNGGYTPLYEVVTGAATVTSWKDYRSSTLFTAGSGAGGPPTGTAGGDLTGTYPNPTIGTNKVTLGQMAQLATARLLGRTTAGTGNVEALTVLPTALVPAFTGDVTNSAGSLAHTLATVNSNVGSFTSANITVNAKGLITAAANGTGSAPTESFVIACSDETTALTAGTGKATFRIPYAFTVTAVRASLTTAQSAGSIFTVDINESGTTIISTKLTIDNTEKTSTTAATPAVISDAALADDAEITIDIDQIGTSGAAGLKVIIIGHQ